MVEIGILDVLPDGTISKLEPEPISVTIAREEPEQHITIEKVDVLDQEHMEEALTALAEHLREYCICYIDVNCVD